MICHRNLVPLTLGDQLYSQIHNFLIGRTWTKMSQYRENDSFLRPSELEKANNLTLRVESWMGGSNVLFSSGYGSLWTSGQDGSDSGNNICRGIFRFGQLSHSLIKITFIRCLQAYWDSLDEMERMQWILWRRENGPEKKSCPRGCDILLFDTTQY